MVQITLKKTQQSHEAKPGVDILVIGGLYFKQINTPDWLYNITCRQRLRKKN